MATMKTTKPYFYENEPITWLGEPMMIAAITQDTYEARQTEFAL